MDNDIAFQHLSICLFQTRCRVFSDGQSAYLQVFIYFQMDKECFAASLSTFPPAPLKAPQCLQIANLIFLQVQLSTFGCICLIISTIQYFLMDNHIIILNLQTVFKPYFNQFVTKVHQIYFVLLAYKSTFHTTIFLSKISTFHYLLIIVIPNEATYKNTYD